MCVVFENVYKLDNELDLVPLYKDLQSECVVLLYFKAFIMILFLQTTAIAVIAISQRMKYKIKDKWAK